jgi:hypothetical protein
MVVNTYLSRLRGSGRLAGTTSSRRTPRQKAADAEAAIADMGTSPIRGE